MKRARTLVVVAVTVALVGLSTAAYAAKPVTSTASAKVSVSDYSQCQNDPPPSQRLDCRRWGNGILNGSNSHYGEGQVTPQRLLLSVPQGAPAETVVGIRYMTLKGSANAHAYDFLATWNLTQKNALRCQGLSRCAPNTPTDTEPMKSDPNPVNPAGPGIDTTTAAHELPQDQRQWVVFGGTIKDGSATVPTHSADPTDPGTDYATVFVTLVAADANGDNKADADSLVQLLFGGHLALGTASLPGWGTGFGSGNISGGPYHLIVDSLNGESAGSRDNQIMAGAIVTGSPSFTVTKSASPTVVNAGGTVTYTITVSNTGTAGGTHTFVDDYDNRITILGVPGGCTNNKPAAGQMECTTGTILPGGSQAIQYQATMPSTFSGAPGGDGCSGSQYPVKNVIVNTPAQSVVCVTAAPSFNVTKTASPTQAVPGQQVTYTLTVSNNGSAAGIHTFVDDYDNRLSPTTPAGCQNNTPVAGQMRCTTGSIQPGGNQVFTYTANMPATFTGTPGGDGCSAAQNQFPVKNVVVGTNAQAVVCVTPTPSFAVTKSANPTQTTPGGQVTYTLTVTNNGSGPGTHTFVDDYDNRLSPTTPAGCQNNTPVAGQMRCTTGPIQPGGNQVFTYTATMPASFTGTPGGDGCSAAQNQFPVKNVVVGTNAQAVVCVTPTPSFAVTKSANPTQTTPGGQVAYTLTVTNNGSGPGTHTFVDDYDNRLSPTTPAGCQNNTPVAGQMQCTTGTIQPGGNQVFTYTATMPATFTGTPGGDGCSTSPAQFPVKNVVVGTPASAVVCVNVTPVFVVTKSANPTQTTPGGQVTYTLTVTNNGSGPGTHTFVDDYDNRLSPTTPAGCQNNTPAAGQMRCTTGTIQPGGNQVFTYTANMPASFTGTPGGDGCSAAQNQFPVKNVVVGTTAQAVVCVNAAPRFQVAKSASKATAVPGEEITYTLEVDNVGTAPGSTTAVDTYAPGVVVTVVPAGCTNDPANRKLSCTTGVLAALTGTQSFVYKATMPATFDGPSGGSGCQPGQYPVVNTVVVPGDSDTARVCVTATPNLVLSKSADVGSVEQGQLVTYTLTLQNTGTAEASGTTIVEDIPAGTAYQSCTAGCTTTGDPVNRATWSVGGLKAGAEPVVVQLVVVVTANEACEICNTARVASPDVNGGVAVNSNTVCLEAKPSPNPGGANADGRATGLQITSHGFGLIGINTSPISYSETSQSGVGGPVLDDETVLSASVSALGIPLVRAGVLNTTSNSTVSAVTNDARNTSTAEVADVCLVYAFNKCTVESSTVRAVASTTANGKTATYSAAGTWIENLKVAGIPVNVTPDQTTTVDLDEVLYGLGSYVKVNERVGSVSTAGPNEADLTVTAIKVHITGTLVLKPIDIVVARATAHSDFPKTPECPPGPDQSVSGHAFIASLTIDPLLVDPNGVLQGYVAIPPTGGADSQSVASVSVGTNGGILSAKAADTATAGGFTATKSSADSHAQVAGDTSQPACVLRTSPTTCIATATVVRSEAHATATAAGASATDTGTKLLDLKVLGVSVSAQANGVVKIGGLGFLVINEQFCDGGASLAANCAGAQHTGRTVRTLRLVINEGNNPFGLLPGVELIVAEAHADATFVSN